MRIISGSRRGLKLKGPKGRETRPTEDRIKESLFNILFAIDSEDVVLDLFAGSGSIGLEFISRGANKVYFVDRSRNSIKCINENINHTRAQENSIVIKNDYLRALNYFSRKNLKFDYIYIDPPYEKGLILKALKSISENSLLADEGLIIVEHESDLKLDDKLYNLIKRDERNYGGKTLTFFKPV